ncbi:VOC family protein [uncultured Ruminococcus sp.]|uniref:VOC family protein n=1 Tax=uncultured Ruminococcus sp. TaxID=165186 RepID=UPI0025FBB55C|nr:hypothetical protein [uncultured Ruminococcus sp.]
MKITGINPQVITKDPEAVIAAFEALGFVRTHCKSGDEGFEFSSVRMEKKKDGDESVEYHVDVISAPTNGLDRDLTTVRINVDDHDAACELLKSKGFTEPPGFGMNVTPSSKYTYLASPSGMIIDVCQHIKNT